MSIRDYSNVPDHLVPEWVRNLRERNRDIARQRILFLQEWEKEKPKWTAKVEKERREERKLWEK
jgi:hypothetical protein